MSTFLRRNEVILAIVLVAFATVSAIISPVFLSERNLINILNQVVVLGILAAGMTVVMISGGIDLSVGTAVSLIGVVVARLMAADQLLTVALAAGLGLGALLGLLNGALASVGLVHPFIVTLGTMTLFQGLALLAAPNGAPVRGVGELVDIALTYFLGLSLPVWILFAVLAALFLFLKYTRLGRYAYSIGGSEEASRLSGIRIFRTKLALYGLNGLLVGTAAILLTSRISSALPHMGTGYELQAIAAVVIGGTPLSGGRGSILGTALGVLLLGVIENSLSLWSVAGAYRYVVLGIVIVIAALSQRQS